MNGFLSDFQTYVYVSRYARWRPDLGRRETWGETIDRYFDFFDVHLKERCGYTIPVELRASLREKIHNMEAMPSMRCFMSAGKALQRDEMAGFNCSYITISHVKAFAEALYILMVGTGVGFSVERQYIVHLPEVAPVFKNVDDVIEIADSKLGWAKGLNDLISYLYDGEIPKIDTSKVRPAGAVLKTFGGRASGPAPLLKMLNFTIDIFKGAAGRKLTSIECHDLVCMIGECVVVGGVRRSALISLSNLSDDRMRAAKSGQWWQLTPWRTLANNSAVYTDESPGMEVFMNEWKALYDSKSGERGIFSRWACNNIVKRGNDFREKHFWGDTGVRYRELNHEWGCNPCSEIILRALQTCNLSEAIVRAGDTLEDVIAKVQAAAVFGTWQSTLTEYRFISKKWSTNAVDERLLGVSMTGIMDHEVLSGRAGKGVLRDWLTVLRGAAITQNILTARELGIPASTAVTCMKPSGTVSSLVHSPSGMHGWHSPHYIRTVRSDRKDPLAQMLIDSGVPYEPDVSRPDSTLVFSFPEQANPNGLLRNSLTAVEQLELWMEYQMYWTDHKPSITVSVKEKEWMKVGSWVYDHFDLMSGVSFLPYDDHVYKQAPFQAIDEATYIDAMNKMPKIKWSDLQYYEKSDHTTGSQELACSSKEGCNL